MANQAVPVPLLRVVPTRLVVVVVVVVVAFFN